MPMQMPMPMMMLRNVELTESKCRELKKKLISDRTIKSLTLYNVRGILNCDFLLNKDGDCCDDCDDSSVADGDSTDTTGVIDTKEEREETTTTITTTGIEELTIERCHLDIKGCQALGRVLRSCSSLKLKSFKMKNVHIPFDDSCLIPLIEGMNEAGTVGCLESINFERVVIGNNKNNSNKKKNGLCRFFSTFGNCTNLRHLRLADCSIQSKDISELATNTIQKLIVQVSFESLDLSRNNIDGSGVDLLLRMGFQQQGNGNNNGINNNNYSVLKRLLLSHNPVGDDGAVYISRFFSSNFNSNTKSNNTRIESLALVDCDIWSKGCKAISKELKYFDTLQELHIVDANQDHDDEGGGEWENHLETILESLKSTNVVLQHFYSSSSSSSSSSQHHHCRQNQINDNNTVDQQWKEIDYYLQLNRAKLRRLSKEPNRYPFALYPTVLKETKTNKKEKQKDDKSNCVNSSKACAAATTTTTTGKENNINTPTATATSTINADVWFDLLRRRPELVSFATFSNSISSTSTAISTRRTTSSSTTIIPNSTLVS